MEEEQDRRHQEMIREQYREWAAHEGDRQRIIRGDRPPPHKYKVVDGRLVRKKRKPKSKRKIVETPAPTFEQNYGTTVPLMGQF